MVLGMYMTVHSEFHKCSGWCGGLLGSDYMVKMMIFDTSHYNVCSELVCLKLPFTVIMGGFYIKFGIYGCIVYYYVPTYKLSTMARHCRVPGGQV